MNLNQERISIAEDSSNDPTTADRIAITYYTDPLCCWSHAFETHWEKFKKEFHAKIKWRYVMGGMIQDWKHFNDPLNSISNPIQMGPVWMHASQIANIKLDSSVWHNDPPSSSYPACIAVKCAALQSPSAGEAYLLKVREAVMCHGKNIAKENVLLDIAHDLGDLINVEKFTASWHDGSGVAEFRKDLQQTRYYQIGRFPTLTMMKDNQPGIIIVGYRPYEILEQAFTAITKGS